MFLRNQIMFVLVVLLAISMAACSSGGTTPAQDGGNPDNNDEPDRISGTVTDDGVPVGGVEVVAYDVTNGSLVANDTTDLDGVYKLNPFGGQYIIVAVGETVYAEPEYINLANDGSTHRLDIGMKRFQNQNMNGFLFCRIMNEDNETPIPNARVKFGNHEGFSDAWGFCFMVGFAIQEAYKFEVSAGGFNARIHEIRRNQFDRNLILKADLFKLTPTSDIGASIGGVVRDIASGNDLGGVFVTIEKPSTDFVPVTYMTNLGGIYRFYNLEKGTYVLTSQRTGYLDDTTQLIINDEEGYFTIFMTPNVEEMATITGFVYDRTGSMPIPNVIVSISNPIFGEKKGTISDGLGRFSFAGLVYGDYYIFANPINPLFVPQGVAVTLNEELHEMQFNMKFNEAGAIMGKALTVENATVDPPIPPQPVSGAKIIAEKMGAPMSGLRFETNTDGRGEYAINGVLPGIYLLKMEFEYAGDKQYSQTEENVPVNAGAATNFDFVDLPWLE